MQQFLTLFDVPSSHPGDQKMVIIGEPGSGKTHALVQHISTLLSERRARPDECLLITTDPRNIIDRLETAAPGLGYRTTVLTIHELGLRIVHDLYDRAGLARGFHVLDDPGDLDVIGLRGENAVARVELLTLPPALLAEDPGLAEAYRNRWRWLYIDDFPDLPGGHDTLTHLVAPPAGNLIVTGGPGLADTFPDARTVRLAPVRSCVPPSPVRKADQLTLL